MTAAPALSTIVVSWKSRDDALALARDFPRDPRHELVVVDNSGELTVDGFASANVRLLSPGRNLGFAGGANRGAEAATAPLLLFLNPDTRPIHDAFDQLLAGFTRFPDAAGLAPRLIDPTGGSQHRWQLARLPGPSALLMHAFFWNPSRASRREPPPGAPVEQPAAAALALRRRRWEAYGGFDEGFAPAWFEDVDLAKRLAAGGERILYWPEASFEHRGGASLAGLGYAGFLEAYDRNLARYLRLHHGTAWALAFRALVPFGALLRVAALPARSPARAPSRAAAARALWGAARAALRGWPAPEASGR